jgi:hypothetical protein
MTNVRQIQDALCKSFCTDIRVIERNGGTLLVDTPFHFPDGDAYSIYLEPLSTGGFRVTDAGITMMHLSYENDITKFREGVRGKVFEQILAEMELKEDDGEFFVESTADDLGRNILRFGQALTKFHDLTFLNRARVESTFYDDLWEAMTHVVSPDKIEKDFIFRQMPNADDYLIDYRVEGAVEPLFVFGIPNRDKARLATIVLEHLLRAQAQFRSLLIFAHQEEIPRGDLARLSNVGGEMVSSLDAQDDLGRKLRKMAA